MTHDCRYVYASDDLLRDVAICPFRQNDRTRHLSVVLTGGAPLFIPDDPEWIRAVVGIKLETQS